MIRGLCKSWLGRYRMRKIVENSGIVYKVEDPPDNYCMYCMEDGSSPIRIRNNSLVFCRQLCYQIVRWKITGVLDLAS